MEVFWEKGYEAASIQDLVEAMEIHRGSLYNTFGSKHDLFLAALERYHEMIVSRLSGIFEEPGPRLEKIRRFFRRVIELSIEAGPKGCLMVNTAMESSGSDPVSAARVLSAFRSFENLFYENLVIARDNGEIGADRDPMALARFFTTTFYGIRVRSALISDPDELRQIAGEALSTLY
jgi:TetR/AcrR family transcriptional repressor of nem operon